MPGCAAIGCNNRSEKGFTMKCFPRNPKLRKIWTERVSRADWEPSNNSFLCHVHFEADQWTITHSGRIKLRKNAVPSIFTVTSTRKSPRKRRKLAKGEEDLYIIEYSDDCSSRALSGRVKNSSYNRFPTILGRSVYAQSACRRANQIAMDKGEMPETIVVSDDVSDTSTKEKKRTNGVVEDSKAMDTTNNTEVTIKKESPGHSNHELDDIEEKLRSICDGEPQSDDKNTIEREIDKKNVILEDNKRKSAKLSLEDKTLPKYSSNNENSSKSQENVDRNTSSHKRRSALETTIDAKKAVVTNVANGTISLKNNCGKASNETSATTRSSTFTIKLTGIDEDVTEIVEGLGTEPILKYKSSADLSNSNKNFVTSVISVTDTYVIKPENDEDETMRKPEIRRWPSLEIKKETCEEMNGTENRSSTKLSLESPEEEDDDTMDHQRLRKKIKFQEEVIRKLTVQLNSSKETQALTNHMSTRSQTKGKVIAPKTCNGDCQNESKDKLLKDFSKRIDSSNETISRLHKSLNEERQNVKNALTQIRQRDNRIKELNWKLNKASKYIERAEKNANNYRKKMMNLQNFVTKKNLEAEACPSSSKSIERPSTVGNDARHFSSNVTPMETAEENNPETTNEDVVYRTVQDIFEESNHSDDDPMIDNPEDFMRQFAGSL